MHRIIGDYAKVLDTIGQIDGVHSVTTGVISLNKSEFEELTFQRFTDHGIRLLAKTTEEVQEIYVVCKDQDKNRVLEQLRSRGIIQEKVKNVGKKSGKSAKPGNKPQVSGSRYDDRRNLVDKPKEKALTLKDMLSPEQLAKLTEQSNGLKEQERVQQEHKRQAEIARREREQKELENNFEYLLKTSKQDWKDFK